MRYICLQRYLRRQYNEQNKVPASGYTTREGCFSDIMKSAEQKAKEIGASDYSIFMMQPWLDVDEAASCVSYVAEKAHTEGAGSTGVYSLGASCTPGMPGPVVLECTVKSVHSGKFRMAGPAGKGLTLDIGRTAVLSCGTTDIMVCERPGGTGDLNFYRNFGIDPVDYDLVVVKANTSFREVYTPIASEIFIADTYGAAAADFTVLPFHKLHKDNFYPFNRTPEFVKNRIND